MAESLTRLEGAGPDPLDALELNLTQTLDPLYGNLTIDDPDLYCYWKHYHLLLANAEAERVEVCPSFWDNLLCWPPTLSGVLSVQSCPAEIRGVLYDTTQNASRLCVSNGTWANKTDYSNCRALPYSGYEEIQTLWDLDEAATIYYIGYGISLVALVAALWIFLYFQDLRCLRNTIHTNLLVTYVLIDLTWIVLATFQSNPHGTTHEAACMMFIVIMYLFCTNFFWMFVEGLYLYILVVKTFSVELVKFYLYAAIGWGIPAVVVAVWATTKALYGNNDLLEHHGCAWQTRDNYDYIFILPVILVLLINLFFLCQIMWVLITKLRAANSVESKQYRKAAKALLVLIPLLGITNVVFIWNPTHGLARVIFTYLQAALLSTQGFTVAVLYCFLNGEVRNSMRYHLERWKTQRGLGRSGGGPRHSLSYRSSSFQDADRLYSARGFRDRGSCMSFTTTTSCVANNCHQCAFGSAHGLGNGSYGPLPLKDTSSDL